MPQIFIIKNSDKKDLGEITYSDGKFKVDISFVEEKRQLEESLDNFSKEGIRDLGEVILKEPIKPGDVLFLGEVRNQLARRGYILIEKKK